MESLIFDLDGTLIDSAPDIHAGVLATLQNEGLAADITFAQTRSFIGKGVPALIEQVRDAKGLHADPDQTQRMVTYFTKLYETAVEHTQLYPNVREVLTALNSQGHPLAICTNKPEAPTFAVLDHFGLTDLFRAFAFGDGPYKRKPDPAPVRHVLDQLGVENAIYIGDSETDAATAANAELPFYLFTQGYRKTPVDQIPHAHTFDDFNELPSLLV